MDAVAPGLRTNIDHRVAGASGLAIEDFVLAHHAERKCIHQRIAAVAWLKLRFAAQVRYAKAVAVAGDAAYHALNNGVILRDQFRLDIRAQSWMGPKRSESITASGRAPIVKMSRRMPPTPVAAPW